MGDVYDKKPDCWIFCRGGSADCFFPGLAETGYGGIAIPVALWKSIADFNGWDTWKSGLCTVSRVSTALGRALLGSGKTDVPCYAKKDDCERGIEV